MKKNTFNNIKTIRKLLHQAVDSTPKRIATFFKTTPGSYGAHDKFLGISVPSLRKLASNFSNLPRKDLQLLLESSFNEERFLALIILTKQYQQASWATKEPLYQFYMQNLTYVNNWNLVDLSAHVIVGAHLWDKDRAPLENLATSTSLWERRIAIVATWYFIRENDLAWTFKIALLLKQDQQDLIHKAVGWMLREAGKRDLATLITFLDTHSNNIPRTMLRYAIERLPQEKRKHYLLAKK